MFGGSVVAAVLGLLMAWKCTQCVRNNRKSAARMLKDKLNSTLDCTTNCAVAGFDCAVSLREQKPTPKDPDATDFFRLPRVRHNVSDKQASFDTADKDTDESESEEDDDSHVDDEDSNYVAMNEGNPARDAGFFKSRFPWLTSMSGRSVARGEQNTDASTEDVAACNEENEASYVTMDDATNEEANRNSTAEIIETVSGIGLEQSYVPLDESTRIDESDVIDVEKECYKTMDDGSSNTDKT